MMSSSEKFHRSGSPVGAWTGSRLRAPINASTWFMAVFPNLVNPNTPAVSRRNMSICLYGSACRMKSMGLFAHSAHKL